MFTRVRRGASLLNVLTRRQFSSQNGTRPDITAAGEKQKTLQSLGAGLAIGSAISGAWYYASRQYETKLGFEGMKELSTEDVDKLKEDCILVFTNPDDDRTSLQMAAIAIQKLFAPYNLPIYVTVRANAVDIDANTLSGLAVVSSRKQTFAVQSTNLQECKISRTTPEELAEFFKVHKEAAEDVHARSEGKILPEMAYDDFAGILASTQGTEKKVLIIATDKTCMLCYLMKPFMRTLARYVKQRADVDMYLFDESSNDFPKGFPFIKGTPSFVLVQKGTSSILEEFRPTDILTRLFNSTGEDKPAVIPGALPPADLAFLKNAAAAVSDRFKGTAMIGAWQQEAAVMNARLLRAEKVFAKDGQETAGFDLEASIHDTMDWDAKFDDEIFAAVARMRREEQSYERDALAIGATMLEKVLLAETLLDAKALETAVYQAARKHEKASLLAGLTQAQALVDFLNSPVVVAAAPKQEETEKQEEVIMACPMPAFLGDTPAAVPVESLGGSCPPPAFLLVDLTPAASDAPACSQQQQESAGCPPPAFLTESSAQQVSAAPTAVAVEETAAVVAPEAPVTQETALTVIVEETAAETPTVTETPTEEAAAPSAVSEESRTVAETKVDEILNAALEAAAALPASQIEHTHVEAIAPAVVAAVAERVAHEESTAAAETVKAQ